LWVFYAGFGFLSGVERYLAGADAQTGKTKDDTDPMARSSLAVAELEKRVRERAAASVLVYDTQFLQDHRRGASSRAGTPEQPRRSLDVTSPWVAKFHPVPHRSPSAGLEWHREDARSWNVIVHTDHRSHR
jgi:hypothetical protein